MHKIQTANLDKTALNPTQTLWTYNGLDCAITAEIYENLSNKLSKQPEIRLTYDFMLAASTPALKIMRRGIKIDTNKLNARLKNIEERILKLSGLQKNKKNKWELVNKKAIIQNIAKAMWGKELNPNSDIQIKDLLYNTLGIPEVYSIKKGQRGNTTVDREALDKLSFVYPRCQLIGKAIIRHRELEKTHGVLTSDLWNGRFHTSMNVAGTETGRWSSNEHPLKYGSNTQNITENIRDLFIPDEGYSMFYADLEQAESRAVAYLSGDENYINACLSGDLHTHVARMLFRNMPWTDDPQENKKLAETIFYRNFTFRDIAKRAGHGLNYGMSPWTLAVTLKIPVDVAELIYENYFIAFPGIKKWQDNIADALQRNGFLITPLGRFRQFHGRLREDSTIREGIAFVPQSLIGDILNIGLIRVHQTLEPNVQVLLNVHDAILGQIRTADVDKYLPKVLECMTIKVPIGDRTMVIGTEAAVGSNWGKQDPKCKIHKDGNPHGLVKWRIN